MHHQHPRLLRLRAGRGIASLASQTQQRVPRVRTSDLRALVVLRARPVFQYQVIKDSFRTEEPARLLMQIPERVPQHDVAEHKIAETQTILSFCAPRLSSRVLSSHVDVASASISNLIQ